MCFSAVADIRNTHCNQQHTRTRHGRCSIKPSLNDAPMTKQPNGTGHAGADRERVTCCTISDHSSLSFPSCNLWASPTDPVG